MSGPGRGWESPEAFDAAIGSVAEEAAKLLFVLGNAGQDAAPMDHPGAADSRDTPDPRDMPEPDGHVAMGHAESCTWCPVCRSVTLARSLSPETLERLADLAQVAAATLAQLATRATGRTGGTDRHPAGSATGADRAATRRPASQAVPVTDDDILEEEP